MKPPDSYAPGPTCAANRSQPTPAPRPWRSSSPCAAPTPTWGWNGPCKLADYFECPCTSGPCYPWSCVGQAVPPAKKWYIIKGHQARAEKLGIPYGFIADPLGARCGALLRHLPLRPRTGAGHELDANIRPGGECPRHPLRDRPRPAPYRRGNRLDWEKARRCLEDERWREEVEGKSSGTIQAGPLGRSRLPASATLPPGGRDRLWLIQEAMRGDQP